MTRQFDRAPGDLRPVTITPHYLAHAEGSVLIEVGHTKVICAASIEDRVPPFLRGTGKGWVTAEYGMLPRATNTRTTREASQGKVGGRTMEIQRLIGRSMRAVVRLERLGERTLWLDCDVIQADGGTRTASITGAFVAMVLALRQAASRPSSCTAIPVNDYVAATSVGIVGGMPLLDLAYEEDSKADVDMNIVKTGDGRFVEVQGTAESEPFDQQALDGLLDLAGHGIDRLIAAPARDRRLDPRPLMRRAFWCWPRPIRNKVREVAAPAARRPVAVRPLADLPPIAEPEETGDTFEANARLKALHYAAAIPGLVVSEDSGLEVDAMGGEPGVRLGALPRRRTATYPERFAAILQRLARRARRGAHRALRLRAGRRRGRSRVLFETRGTVEGRIAARPGRAPAASATTRFFFSPELGCTLAEAGDAKAAVSHRGRAFAALARWLDDLE